MLLGGSTSAYGRTLTPRGSADARRTLDLASLADRGLATYRAPASEDVVACARGACVLAPTSHLCLRFTVSAECCVVRWRRLGIGPRPALGGGAATRCLSNPRAHRDARARVPSHHHSGANVHIHRVVD